MISFSDFERRFIKTYNIKQSLTNNIIDSIYFMKNSYLFLFLSGFELGAFNPGSISFTTGVIHKVKMNFGFFLINILSEMKEQ